MREEIKTEEFGPIIKKSGLDKSKAKKYLGGIYGDMFHGSKVNKWEVDSGDHFWSLEGQGNDGDIVLILDHDGETIEGGLSFNEDDINVSSPMKASDWKKNPVRTMSKLLKELKDKFRKEWKKIEGKKGEYNKFEDTQLSRLVDDLNSFV